MAGQVIDIPCAVGGGGQAAAAAPACVISSVAGGVLVDWEAVDGETTYQVRVDNGWVATVQDGTQFTVSQGSPNANYEVRYRMAGQVIDLSCS